MSYLPRRHWSFSLGQTFLLFCCCDHAAQISMSFLFNSDILNPLLKDMPLLEIQKEKIHLVCVKQAIELVELCLSPGKTPKHLEINFANIL